MTTLADAYEALAEAAATIALELRATTAQDAPDGPLPFEDDPEPVGVGSASMCPAHRTEYRSGKYGPYCPNQGTDPKWTNARGYCTLTPENAAAYLRQKAGR